MATMSGFGPCLYQSNDPITETEQLKEALRVARDALLSYQYGNSSPELAQEVVEHIQKILQDERKDNGH